MAGGGAAASRSSSLRPSSAEEVASSVPRTGGGRGGSSRPEPSPPPPLTGGEFLLHLLQRGPQSQANSAVPPASGGGRGEGHDDPAVAVVGPSIPFLRPPPGDFSSGAHPQGSPPWAGAGYPGFRQAPWAAPPSEFGLPRRAAPPGFHHHVQYSNQYHNIASQPPGGVPSFSPPLGFQAGPFDARNIHRNPVHSQHSQHQHQHRHQQHQHQQHQHQQQQHQQQQQQQQQHYSWREGFPMEGGPVLFGSLASAGGSRLSEGDPFLAGKIDASSRGVLVRPDVMKARPVAHNASSGYDHERERVLDSGRSSATGSFPGSNWSFQPRANQHQGPSHRWKETGEPLLQKKQGAPLQRSGKSEPGKLPFSYQRDRDVKERAPSSNVTNGEHTLEELAHLGIGKPRNPSHNNESMLSRSLPPVNQLDHSSSSLQREAHAVLPSNVKEHRECLQFGNVCTVQRVEQFNNGDVEGVVCIEEQNLSSQHVTDSSEVTDEISEKGVNVHVHASRGKDYRLDDSRGHHVLSQRMRYRRRELRCRRNIGGFSPSLLAIYESLIPSEEEKAKQRHLLQSLEKLVIKEWPNARLYLYGSCANSFGVSNSDIDICLAIDENDINKSEVLLKLADILQSDNLQNVQALTRARVPIVKLMDPLTGLSCDICINNLLAVVNTKLLRDYAKIDVRLRQLAFIVKHWAKTRGVNDTYQGTLSSYSYVLMCIHFLQLRRPAILPCLQEMKVTYVVKVDDIECAFFDQVEELRGFGAENRENIAELLWSFFSYWAYHHDYANDAISVRIGGIISKQSKDWTKRVGNDRHLICIEDPFEVTHDLGRVVDKYTIKILREEFERAAEIMQYDPNPCVKLFEPYVRVPEQGRLEN